LFPLGKRSNRGEFVLPELFNILVLKTSEIVKPTTKIVPKIDFTIIIFSKKYYCFPHYNNSPQLYKAIDFAGH